MSTTATASGGMNHIGLDIPGGEYGSTGSGTLGTDYVYPSQDEINYYASQGMTVIRCRFGWNGLSRTRTDHWISRRSLTCSRWSAKPRRRGWTSSSIAF